MNNGKVHPLRSAYISSVKRIYNKLLVGDKNPALTERAAMKISKLGLSYDDYISMALKLCDSTAKYMGWEYPYYNAVIGDKTISKIENVLKYAPDAGKTDFDEEALFEYELSYATEYICWWFGESPRPRREEDVPDGIKIKVAEYLCHIYGIPYTSSNYNMICQALEKHGR